MILEGVIEFEGECLEVVFALLFSLCILLPLSIEHVLHDFLLYDVSLTFHFHLSHLVEDVILESFDSISILEVDVKNDG